MTETINPNEELVQIVESHKESIAFFKEVFSALDSTIQSLHEIVQQLDARMKSCEDTIRRVENKPQVALVPQVTPQAPSVNFSTIENKLTEVSSRLNTLENVLKSSRRSFR